MGGRGGGGVGFAENASGGPQRAEGELWHEYELLVQHDLAILVGTRGLGNTAAVVGVRGSNVCDYMYA